MNREIYNMDMLRSSLRKKQKELDISISKWANDAGMSESGLRHFLSGENETIGVDKVIKLAGAAKTTIVDLLLNEKEEAIIPIDHFIGIDGELFSLPKTEQKNIHSPVGFNVKVEAAVVKDNYMFPVFREGQIIFYTRHLIKKIPPIKKHAQVNYNQPVGSSKYAEFFGKPCLVELSNGRILLRELKHGGGSGNGKYILHSYGAPDKENVEIRGAYKIVFIKTDLTNNF